MAGLRDENVVRVMHIAQAYFFLCRVYMFDVCYKKLLGVAVGNRFSGFWFFLRSGIRPGKVSVAARYD